MALTTNQLQSIIDEQAQDLNKVRSILQNNEPTSVILSDGTVFSSYQKIINDHVEAQQQISALQVAVNVKINAVYNYFNALINKGVVYQNKIIQIDDKSRLSISAAALMATIAINNKVGDQNNYRWVDPDVDFGWIAEDNTVINMDAPTCVAFGLLIAQYYTKLVFNARFLKNTILNLQNINEVQNFDFNTGWPLNIVK
jgi:hypothetical protein